eukprot:TCONS_00031883-protein
MEVEATTRKRKLEQQEGNEEEGEIEDNEQSKNDSKKEECDFPVVKKKGKKKKKNKVEGPNLTYNLTELFQNGGKRRGGTHLSFLDIRTLMMLAVHGDRFPVLPTWCRIRNWLEIKKTFVIALTGISGKMYTENKELFKNLGKYFDKETPIPVKREGSNGHELKSPIRSLLFYKLPKRLFAEKNQLIEYEDGKKAKFTFKDLLLSDDRLQYNDFPVWNSAAQEHGVTTTRLPPHQFEVTPTNNESEIFALDCEMCEVLGGEKALTRISIVNRELKTVYDTYVKPDLPIIDYLTQYSGITKEILDDVTTTLEKVKKKLRKFVKPDTVLVGHSLDFDLRALKLHHDHVIDTSEIFPSSRGPMFKPSLKKITNQHLGRDIQTSTTSGHCSIEDAKACMELVNLKLKNGLRFGYPMEENESVFEALERAKKTGGLISTHRKIRQYPSCRNTRVFDETDKKFVTDSKELLQTNDFVFTHLETREASSDTKSTSITQDRMRRLDEYLGNLLEDIPAKTMVIVSLSGRVPDHIKKLAKDKQTRNLPEVKAAVNEAKQGFSFIKITP